MFLCDLRLTVCGCVYVYVYECMGKGIRTLFLIRDHTIYHGFHLMSLCLSVFGRVCVSECVCVCGPLSVYVCVCVWWAWVWEKPSVFPKPLCEFKSPLCIISCAV